MKAKTDKFEKENEALRIQTRRLQNLIDLTAKSGNKQDGVIHDELQKMKTLFLTSNLVSHSGNEDVSKLKAELAEEKRLREEAEKQLRENNEEITHLYIDAEVHISSLSTKLSNVMKGS